MTTEVTLDDTQQHDLKITANSKAGLGPMFIDISSKSAWVGEVAVNKGKDAHAFLFNLEKNPPELVSTVTLPYGNATPKTPTTAAPWIDDLLLHQKVLWMSDNEHGVLYRYDATTLNANAAATIYYESDKNPSIGKIEFGALAFQPGGAGTGPKDLLWVLDMNLPYLWAFDATQDKVMKHTYQVQLSGMGNSIQSLAYHAKTQTLWMVVQKSADGEFQLGALRATDPLPGVKYFSLDGAQSLAIHDDLLYVAGSAGQIWQIKIDSMPTKMPDPMVTLPRGAENVVGLTVDNSGYVWASNMDGKGRVYGIMPPKAGEAAGKIEVSYGLLDATAPVYPTALAWWSDDSLFVTDEAENGRLIRINPLPKVPPIDPAGRASYTLEVTPDKSDDPVIPGATFEATKGITFRAKSTKTGNPAIDALVTLSVISVDNGVKASLTEGSERSDVITASAGLVVKDFVSASDSGNGKINLVATGRGNPPPATYTGEVSVAVTDIKFVPNTSRSTPQKEVFDIPNASFAVELTPASSPKRITVTLEGPDSQNGAGNNAHFGDASSTSTEVNSKEKIDSIKAGNMAGDVIVKAEVGGVGGKSTSMTWHVVPVPTQLDVLPNNGSVHKTDWQEQFQDQPYTLKGYKIWKDPSSGAVGVPGWPLRLELDTINVLEFTPGGRILDVKTFDNGEYTLTVSNDDSSQVKFHDVGTVSITAKWNDKLDGSGAWIDGGVTKIKIGN
ncbi:hypothetical protein PMI16_02596 [Herbaspirillum sp. CF444]|uniref:hypothetical protein n=1 Tax=Herbaspirillum sp. CF444 TaxID=1144319 RepID=UPI00027257D4|nr:hypothetical protein [Herbaspirillum sp. CF444]EJL88100.1 hypothetical protein PMI16_02596 [Herbaspirillum sp. CF444]